MLWFVFSHILIYLEMSERGIVCVLAFILRVKSNISVLCFLHVYRQFGFPPVRYFHLFLWIVCPICKQCKCVHFMFLMRIIWKHLNVINFIKILVFMVCMIFSFQAPTVF